MGEFCQACGLHILQVLPITDTMVNGPPHSLSASGRIVRVGLCGGKGGMMMMLTSFVCTFHRHPLDGFLPILVRLQLRPASNLLRPLHVRLPCGFAWGRLTCDLL